MTSAISAAVHGLPRRMVIPKLKLIPVVWCHLHPLPEGVIFNMGPLLFHRALCWGVQVCYICAGVCLLVCACARVSLRERGRAGESVAMHFYTSSHWSLHM